MPDTMELSRGHAAEVRFATEMGLPYPGPERDYTDVVTDEYLQAISSRDDFIGLEHLYAFAEQAGADIVKPGLFARRITDPELRKSNGRRGHNRVFHYSEADPTEIGLVVKPRGEVGLSTLAPGEFGVWEGDSRAIQVGSLIDLAHQFTPDGFEFSEYTLSSKSVVEGLGRLAAFLEARIQKANEPKRAVEYLKMVTDEHLSSIRSFDDFIGEEHVMAFRDQASPDISQKNAESLNEKLFGQGEIPNGGDNPAIKLPILPRHDDGLKPVYGLEWETSVQIGKLIDCVDEYDHARRLEQIGNRRQAIDAERLLLLRFVAYLKLRVGYSMWAETAAGLDKSMAAMDKFVDALEDPESTVRTGWSPEFRNEAAQKFIRSGKSHLKAMEATIDFVGLESIFVESYQSTKAGDDD